MTSPTRVKLIAISVLFFLCLLLILQNREPIVFSFLFWQSISFPKFYLIGLCLALGALGGVLVTLLFQNKFIKKGPKEASSSSDYGVKSPQ